jgi:anti-sigma factor RsiW
VRAADRPVDDDDLQAWIDDRLPSERASMVDSYLAAHPGERQRWSQYADQRQALRAAFNAQPAEPIPARLRVAC